MELRQLRYFVGVAEELHFGHASARLGVAQPALSRQIQALEEELQIQLLLRNRRRVQLTPAGQVFLERCRLILSRVEDAALAARHVGSGVGGSLSLGFVGSATYQFLPAVLRAFRKTAPRVELTLSEMTVHMQLEALAERRIDVGILRLPPKRQGLVFRPISRESLMVALPSAHRLARLPAIRLVALAREPFVLYPDNPQPSWTQFIEGLCQQSGFQPIIVQRTIEIQTTLSLVAAGIGLSIVPACVGTISRKGVVFRRLTGIRARTELLVAYRDQDPSPGVRAFLKVIRHTLRLGAGQKQAHGGTQQQAGGAFDATR